MLSTRSLIAKPAKIVCKCNYYLRNVYYASSLGGQGKFMQKLMAKKQSKREWFIGETKMKPLSVNLQPKKTISKRRSRRMMVLDKLFMRHISDLMTNSEITADLTNRGIEITFVQVTPDYNLVRVYWIAKDDCEHEFSVPTEEVLHNCAAKLRHELSQLRIIGVVPPIQFIKDKQYMLVNEVEKLLRIANVQSEEECSSDIFYSNENDLETEDSAEHVAENKDDFYDVKLPEMRHDVLGFDHYKIMAKVKSSLNKAQNAANRPKWPIQNEHQLSKISLASMDSANQKVQEKLLENFLKKRKIDERRKFKTKNKTKTDPSALDHEEYNYPNVLEDSYNEYER